MDKKRPIDKMRDRGGHTDIGTPEDGAIEEMLNVGGRLLIIKERSVYELRMADDIDPKRENPNVPRASQRLIVDLGTESELFSRVFLTAKQLFKSEYLPDSINPDELLFLTLEVVQELAALEKEITEYIEVEEKACDVYEERKNKKLAHAVPSIPDIKTRSKTIFQKGDQALQGLLAIIRKFYPDFDQNSYYKSFLDYISNKDGEEDPFTKFLQKTIPFIMLVRNIRNCLEHRRTETEIKDFELQLNNDIISPTLEVDYLGSKVPRTSLSGFLPSVTENLVTIIENMMAYLCGKNTRSNSVIPSEVRFVPEEKRRNKFIKFAYWLPIGDGGYYHQ